MFIIILTLMMESLTKRERFRKDIRRGQIKKMFEAWKIDENTPVDLKEDVERCLRSLPSSVQQLMSHSINYPAYVTSKLYESFYLVLKSFSGADFVEWSNFVFLMRIMASSEEEGAKKRV